MTDAPANPAAALAAALAANPPAPAPGSFPAGLGAVPPVAAPPVAAPAVAAPAVAAPAGRLLTSDEVADILGNAANVAAVLAAPGLVAATIANYQGFKAHKDTVEAAIAAGDSLDVTLGGETVAYESSVLNALVKIQEARFVATLTGYGVDPSRV